MADQNNESLYPIKSPTSRVKKVRYIILLVVLGLAVHLLLPQIATFQHSYQVLKDMLVWAVILAVIAQVISYLGSGYMLKSLVHFSKHSLSIFKSMMIAMAAASFGMVAGGIVGTATATYRWMKKEKVSNEAATLAGTIPGLFNNIILILISTFGLIYLLLAHELSKLQLLGFIFTLTAVVVVLAYRLISFWLPLIVGFLMIPILQGKHRHLSSL